MRQVLVITGVVVGCIICLAGYLLALADWVDDFKTGTYATNEAEALLETGAIVLYTYAGFDFFKKRMAH
ncbi:hypothetical protein WBJ53_26580 [Spirosoma sp. SC4-14]|uniref:hypothetical protein n=1 Tax=Spirosoma sp. SC4-14 TaxID=3128900 RepID=UPI0030D3D463